MNSPPPTRVRHEFRERDFVGGHPVVDFVNTVTARDTVPLDWLDDHIALDRWASLNSLPALLDSSEGPRELLRCTELREALHAVLSAVVDGGPVPPEAAATIEENWREAAAGAHLDLQQIPATLSYGNAQDASALRHALAGAAVGLLSDLPRERLRRCPGEHCGWFFLDTSKAGRRRWCDMATCGTSDKNRRRRPKP